MARVKPSRRLQLKDLVARRTTQTNVILEEATGRRPRRHQRWRDGRTGPTVTVSFTLTEELDQLIHELAVQENTSRSAIVRAATLQYVHDRLRSK